MASLLVWIKASIRNVYKKAFFVIFVKIDIPTAINKPNALKKRKKKIQYLWLLQDCIKPYLPVNFCTLCALIEHEHVFWESGGWWAGGVRLFSDTFKI